MVPRYFWIAVVACPVALACGENVSANLQVLRVTKANEVSTERLQCSSLSGDESGEQSVSGIAVASPGGGRPDFWVEESVSEDGVSFKFGSGSATREDKLYRNVFFESKKLDRFAILSLEGNHYVVSVWGADECETCPPGVQSDGELCGAAEALELIADSD